MTAFVALLRAVNVAGNNLVPMAALKAMALELGLAKPRTLLQSGNLVFDCDGIPAADLEARLARTIAAELNVTTDVIVRTAAQWQTAIESNPLAAVAATDPAHLLMVCCQGDIAQQRVVAMMAAIKGRETVRAVGRQLYVAYPDGIGHSKLTAAVIDRHIGSPGTGRNWKTVLKISRALNGEK